MTDTSKEAVELLAAVLVGRAPQNSKHDQNRAADALLALLSERDALRAQLQAARDEALEEGRNAVSASCFALPGNSSSASYNAGVRDSLAVLRALKSTSAKGEG